MRTKLLLHIVDIAPFDEIDPSDAAKTIIHELEKYNPDLAKRDRWLVLNKTDLLSDEEVAEKQARVVAELNWQGPVFHISAIKRLGTEPLCYAIMERLRELRSIEEEAIREAAEKGIVLEEKVPEIHWPGEEGLKNERSSQIQYKTNAAADDMDEDLE